MKTNKPKISFNTSPVPVVDTSPEVFLAENPSQMDHDERVSQADGQGTSPDLYSNDVDEFYEVGSPDSFEPAPAPQPVVQTVVDQEFDRAEWEQRLTAPPIEPTPIPAPVAKTNASAQNARLAALGQMAQPDAGFLARNGGLLGVAAVVGTTFFLGLGAAIWMFNGDEEGTQQQATFSAPMTEPSVAVPAEAEPVAETATRALTPDMTNVSTVIPEIVSTPQSDLTATVLAGLQRSAAQPQQPERSNARLNREALEILSRNKIRMLREGVMAGVYEIEQYEQSGVERVRLLTINAPLVSDYASEPLLEAMAAGQIEMSRSLITPQGAVDVETMMFNLVQTSLLNDHGSEGSDAALDMSRKIFAASVARTQTVNGKRVYRVQAGDSLAYIALQFFGSPTEYPRILEANQSTLQSPEQIQLGQRLIIPS